MSLTPIPSQLLHLAPRPVTVSPYNNFIVYRKGDLVSHMGGVWEARWLEICGEAPRRLWEIQPEQWPWKYKYPLSGAPSLSALVGAGCLDVACQAATNNPYCSKAIRTALDKQMSTFNWTVKDRSTTAGITNNYLMSPINVRRPKDKHPRLIIIKDTGPTSFIDVVGRSDGFTVLIKPRNANSYINILD